MPPFDVAVGRAAGPLFDAPDKDYGNNPLGKLGARQVVADAGGRARASEHGRWDGFTRGAANLWARTKEIFMSAPEASASKFNRAQKEFSRQFDNLLGELNTGAPNMDNVFKRLGKMGEMAKDMRANNPDVDIRGLMEARAARNLANLNPGSRAALQNNLRHIDLDQLHTDVAADKAAHLNRILEAVGEIGNVRADQMYRGLRDVFGALHVIKGQVLAGAMFDPSRATDAELSDMIGAGGLAGMGHLQAGDGVVDEGLERLSELRRGAREEAVNRSGMDRGEKIDKPLAKMVQDLRLGGDGAGRTGSILQLGPIAAQHLRKLDTLGLLPEGSREIQLPPIAGPQAVLLDSIARMPEDDQRLLLNSLPSSQLDALLRAHPMEIPGGATPDEMESVRAVLASVRDARVAALTTRMSEVRESLQEGGTPVALSELVKLHKQLAEDSKMHGSDLTAVNAQKELIATRLGTVYTPESHPIGEMTAPQMEELLQALNTFGAGPTTETGTLARALAERLVSPHRVENLDQPLAGLVEGVRLGAQGVTGRIHNMFGAGARHLQMMQRVGVVPSGLDPSNRATVLLHACSLLPTPSRTILITAMNNVDLEMLIASPETAIPFGATPDQVAGMREMMRAERQRRLDAAMEQIRNEQAALGRGENVGANLIALREHLDEAAKLGGDLTDLNLLRTAVQEQVAGLGADAIPLGDLPDGQLNKVTSALTALGSGAGALHGAVATERTRRLEVLEAPYRVALGRAMTALSEGNFQQMMVFSRQADALEQAVFAKHQNMGEKIDVERIPQIRQDALQRVLNGMTPLQLQGLQRHAASPRAFNLGTGMSDFNNTRPVSDREDAPVMMRSLTGLADRILTADRLSRPMLEGHGLTPVPSPELDRDAEVRITPENLHDLSRAYGLDVSTY